MRPSSFENTAVEDQDDPEDEDAISEEEQRDNNEHRHTASGGADDGGEIRDRRSAVGDGTKFEGDHDPDDAEFMSDPDGKGI